MDIKKRDHIRERVDQEIPGEIRKLQSEAESLRAEFNTADKSRIADTWDGVPFPGIVEKVDYTAWTALIKTSEWTFTLISVELLAANPKTKHLVPVYARAFTYRDFPLPGSHVEVNTSGIVQVIRRKADEDSVKTVTL